MIKREEGDLNIRKLFEEFWIVKKDMPELYRDISKLISPRIKTSKEARSFIQDELGYHLKFREGAIRVVKRPNKGSAKPWMGISDFQNKEEYIMLIVLLDYLSDDSTSQFLFSDYKTYLDEFSGSLYKFDWEKKNTRYQIRRVLEVAEGFGLITCVEGNVQNRFVEDFDGMELSRIALYDNNKLTREFLPDYTEKIFNIEEFEDFCKIELGDDLDESNISMAAKRFALRELLLTPSYHESDWKPGYDYLKQKPQIANRIAEQLDKYLGIQVAYTSSTAFSTVDADATGNKQAFLVFASNQTNKIILSFNTILREYMETEERDQDDSLLIPEEKFELIFATIYQREAADWTIEYRDKPRNYCYEEIKDRMEQLKFIKIEGGYIRLLPQISKITGVFDLGEKPDENEGLLREQTDQTKQPEKDPNQMSFF